MGALAARGVCVGPAAWGYGEDCEQTLDSSCKIWLEGEATCWHAQLRIPGCCVEMHGAGCPSEHWWVLGSAPFPAPSGVRHWHSLGEGRGGKQTLSSHRAARGMSHQLQGSFAFVHRASEQQLGCAEPRSLLQVLPTQPAAPPCTRSAPSAASTWWASARSQTACTSAPTPSPAQTSGTRRWLSPAAAPTPVSSTPGPPPPGCSGWGGSVWRWSRPERCPLAASPAFAHGCRTQPLGPTGTVRLRGGQLVVFKPQGRSSPAGHSAAAPLQPRGAALWRDCSDPAPLPAPSRLTVPGVTIAFPQLCSSSAPPAPRFWGS